MNELDAHRALLKARNAVREYLHQTDRQDSPKRCDNGVLAALKRVEREAQAAYDSARAKRQYASLAEGFEAAYAAA